jgi:hypothetical protein
MNHVSAETGFGAHFTYFTDAGAALAAVTKGPAIDALNVTSDAAACAATR